MLVEKKGSKLVCRSIEVVEAVRETLDGFMSIESSDAIDMGEPEL